VIEWTSGNLFEADVEALVNAVNTVGVMGAGLALQFKETFPANFKAYAAECKAKRLVVGRVFVFEQASAPRYLINFPTKQHWKGALKPEYVRDGLVDLVAQVERLGIASIAVPALGCGLGGLEWSEVRPMIEAAFAPLRDVRVVVYEAPPPTPRRPSGRRGVDPS
jgi:O-acetyl-ADP-ribose deacetylase (regulator of RNase III)